MSGVKTTNQALSTRVSIAFDPSVVVTLPVIHRPMSWLKAVAPWNTLSEE